MATARPTARTERTAGGTPPADDGLTEGFDTHDLKDAKALLEELA